MAQKFVLLMPVSDSRIDNPRGKLVLGYVGFHRELRQDGYYTCGGGSWIIDEEKKTIELYDYSSDFGEAQFADRDWKYIEFEKQFTDYKITYQYPHYCLRGSEHAGELIDVKPLLKYCL